MFDVLALLPVWVVRELLAVESWSSALPLTSLPDASSSSSWPPAALAWALVTLADEPVADRVRSPVPAAMDRLLVAVTSCSTTASASARPMTTVPVTASAFAVVLVVAVCVAVREIGPVVLSVSAAAPPIVARVVTVTSAIAALAVRETVEPGAPAAPASA